MAKPAISHGTAHQLPADLRKALLSAPAARMAWEKITPLARNEWICWTISVKQQKTRDDHVRRVVKELAEGKRRPCCWIGCIHRADKPMNASQKWIVEKSNSKKQSANIR